MERVAAGGEEADVLIWPEGAEADSAVLGGFGEGREGGAEAVEGEGIN